MPKRALVQRGLVTVAFSIVGVLAGFYRHELEFWLWLILFGSVVGLILTWAGWRRALAALVAAWRVLSGKEESTAAQLATADAELAKCRRQIGEARLEHFAQLREATRDAAQPQLSVTIRSVGYERADVPPNIKALFAKHTQWTVTTERLIEPVIDPMVGTDITVRGNSENLFMGTVAFALTELLGYRVAQESVGHDSGKRSVTIDVHPLPKP